MRPTFHFTAESGWINDPHGITHHNGKYHLFFQYVPDSTVWAPNCHWGHATGADLFSLREQRVAIAPGEGDGGIWTGSLVTDDVGQTRIFYTSTSQPNIGIGRVRVATPDDGEWMSWTKGAFVADAPADLDIVAYRDPFLVREPEGWRMFLGAGLADGTATALSYRSHDLESWEYEGIALERSTNETEHVWMGALWECPQFIEVDSTDVMVSSVWDDDVLYYAGYGVGDYADGHFDARSWGRLTYGPSYYAPSYFRDADGRPCLTFWMRGVSDITAGWASAHSVPHVLSMLGDTLVATPHPDLERYRGEPVDGSALPGVCADIVWTTATTDELLVSGDGADVVRFVIEGGELTAHVGQQTHSMPVTGEVRVILDANAIEVSSAAGVLGLAVEQHSDRYSVSVKTGSLQAWPLAR